jgi:osmotically-inducible protein OsmY
VSYEHAKSEAKLVRDWSDAMRLPFSVVSFGFVMLVGSAVAQTTPQTQTPPVNPSTPATRIGDGAQSKSGTPVSPGTATPSTTGGVAGSASSSSGQNPDADNPNRGISAATDADLETQIQTALSKEPTLTGDSARVNVSGETIELAGSVGTNKEKITATRIVQSYAGGKKLVNHLTVVGKGEKSPPRAGNPDTSNRDQQPAATNPSKSVAPGEGNTASPAKPPQDPQI